MLDVWMGWYAMSLESQLQVKLLIEAPTRLPALRLFRRNVGAAKMHGNFVVQFGIKGQCDLYGLTRGGRHVEVELKSSKKYLSSEQKAWQAWCAEWEVPHVVLKAKEGETVDQTVSRWCLELEGMLG